MNTFFQISGDVSFMYNWKNILKALEIIWWYSELLSWWKLGVCTLQKNFLNSQKHVKSPTLAPSLAPASSFSLSIMNILCTLYFIYLLIVSVFHENQFTFFFLYFFCFISSTKNKTSVFNAETYNYSMKNVNFLRSTQMILSVLKNLLSVNGHSLWQVTESWGFRMTGLIHWWIPNVLKFLYCWVKENVLVGLVGRNKSLGVCLSWAHLVIIPLSLLDSYLTWGKQSSSVMPFLPWCFVYSHVQSSGLNSSWIELLKLWDKQNKYFFH